jgi:dihydrodipicolinate synthase/N-acetylneuraminate lyase
VSIGQFRGILPAVVTPSDEKRRFWPAAFERLLSSMYDAGVDGVYVCGQTGEGLAQPTARWKQVLECAVGCTPRGKQVIARVGAHSTKPWPPFSPAGLRRRYHYP